MTEVVAAPLLKLARADLPDADDVAALTAHNSNEMIILLSDCLNVQEAVRRGCDPAAGRVPTTTEQQKTLLERIAKEEQRLRRVYGGAAAAHAEGFGAEAAKTLDEWVRKAVAWQGSRAARALLLSLERVGGRERWCASIPYAPITASHLI